VASIIVVRYTLPHHAVVCLLLARYAVARQAVVLYAPLCHAVASHAVARYAVACHAVASAVVARYTMTHHAVVQLVSVRYAVARHAVARHKVARHAVAYHAVDRHAVPATQWHALAFTPRSGFIILSSLRSGLYAAMLHTCTSYVHILLPFLLQFNELLGVYVKVPYILYNTDNTAYIYVNVCSTVRWRRSPRSACGVHTCTQCQHPFFHAGPVSTDTVLC